jgi:hypothetical protein
VAYASHPQNCRARELSITYLYSEIMMMLYDFALFRLGWLLPVQKPEGWAG